MKLSPRCSARIKQRLLEALRLADLDDSLCAPEGIWRVSRQDIAEQGEEGQLRYKGPGWYHTDETFAEAYGPYPTFRAAKRALDYYCRTQLR